MGQFLLALKPYIAVSIHVPEIAVGKDRIAAHLDFDQVGNIDNSKAPPQTPLQIKKPRQS
jgi:hypothetical protein